MFGTLLLRGRNQVGNAPAVRSSWQVDSHQTGRPNFTKNPPWRNHTKGKVKINSPKMHQLESVVYFLVTSSDALEGATVATKSPIHNRILERDFHLSSLGNSGG